MNSGRIDNHLVNTRTGVDLAETCIIILSFIPKYNGVFGQPVFHQLKVSYKIIFPTEMRMFRGGMTTFLDIKALERIALTVRVSFAVTVILPLLSAEGSSDWKAGLREKNLAAFDIRADGGHVVLLKFSPNQWRRLKFLPSDHTLTKIRN